MSDTTDLFRAPMDPDRALDVAASTVASSTADHVEVAVLGRAGEYTRFVGDRIHQPQDVTELQVLVRAVVDGHAGRAATGRLDRLEDTVATATRIARDLAAAAGRAGTARVGRPTRAAEPALWREDTASFTAAERVAAAGTAMRRAAAVGGSAAGMFGRAVTQIAVATSEGIARHAVATEAGGSLTVGCDDSTAYWIDLDRSRDALRLDEAVEATVARAVAGRGRVPLPAGSYTVVLGPQAVGELLGFLPEFGFAGDLAAAGVGLAARRAGERVASALVRVADDALQPRGLPIPFDIEGTSKRVVPMLTDGVVGEPVTDLATAAALGRAPTGHAHIAREEPPSPVAANLVMAPGGSSERDLIAGVEDGVYVERVWYTRLVDRVAGTVTGVSRDGCFRITDGRLGRPVAGARFTQSVTDLLASVDGVGDTVRCQPVMNVWNGAVTAPALRGHGFRFGPRPTPGGA